MNLKKLLTNLFKRNHKKEPEEVEARALHKPKFPKYPSKLNDEQRETVAVLIGRGMNNAEVLDYVKVNFGIEMHHTNLTWYRKAKKYKAVIQKAKAKYIRETDDEPDYHKRIRMSKVSRAYEVAYKRKNPNAMISAMEHQRREAEGSGDVNINMTSNRFYKWTDEDIDRREKEIVRLLREYDGKDGKGVIEDGEASSEE